MNKLISTLLIILIVNLSLTSSFVTQQGVNIIDALYNQNTGNLEKGEIEFSQAENKEIGYLIGPKIENQDIKINGEINLQKQESTTFKQTTTKLYFQNQKSSIDIKDNSFQNIKTENSKSPPYIELDETGNLLQANFEVTKQTQININGAQYTIPENGKIYYKKSEPKSTLEITANSEINKIPKSTNIEIQDNQNLDGIKIKEYNIQQAKLTTDQEYNLVLEKGFAEINNINFSISQENIQLCLISQLCEKSYIKIDQDKIFSQGELSINLPNGDKISTFPETTIEIKNINSNNPTITGTNNYEINSKAKILKVAKDGTISIQNVEKPKTQTKKILLAQNTIIQSTQQDIIVQSQTTSNQIIYSLSNSQSTINKKQTSSSINIIDFKKNKYCKMKERAEKRNSINLLESVQRLLDKNNIKC